MTDTTQTAASASLGALRLAELQSLAGSMGIPVSAKMRKADLVTAIRDQRVGGSRHGAGSNGSSASQDGRRSRRAQSPTAAPEPVLAAAPAPVSAPAEGDRSQEVRNGSQHSHERQQGERRAG